VKKKKTNDLLVLVS